MHKSYWMITLVVALAGAAVGYILLARLPAAVLAGVVTLILLVLPGVFLLGFWMGKTELRGFLAGFDRSLDRMMTAVDTRDAKRASQPPSPNILVLPPDARPDLPRITHRSASRDEEDL